MKNTPSNTTTDYNPDLLAAGLLNRPGAALLLFGPSGSGKSTLARELAARVTAAGQPCFCLGGDPGSPAFGMPGAACLGRWQQGHWQLLDFEPLCSLDAVRYRLPLIVALRQLLLSQGADTAAAALVIDAPGVIAGAAGEEFLSALLAITAVSRVCYLGAQTQARILSVLRPPPAPDGPTVVFMRPGTLAHGSSKTRRAEARSQRWRAFLRDSEQCNLSLEKLSLQGTGSAIQSPEQWRGRQCALRRGTTVVAMGEILSLNGDCLSARLVPHSTICPGAATSDALTTAAAVAAHADRLLVRDAVTSASGLLRTQHFDNALAIAVQRQPTSGIHTAAAKLRTPPSSCAPGPAGYNPRQPRSGDPVSVHLGSASATMVNGIFGDPLLHVQLHNQRRHLLFDLGEAGRLPTRVVHQTSDIFLSHSHADHIGGFLWFLRSRIGYYPRCRIYGPPGTAQRIQGLVQGLLWDRAEDRAPQFEVAELHQQSLRRWRLVAGDKRLQALAERPLANQVVLEEPAFRVRAATLEHCMATQAAANPAAARPLAPVLAYSLELAPRFNVSKEKLSAFEVAPGSWLQALKQHLEKGENNAELTLPNGKRERIDQLAPRLLVQGKGEKLVYATDLADNTDNRDKLIALARDANVLFCEAPYRSKDADLALANGHLTTAACGQIATLAGAQQLLPFHFSKRYEKNPAAVYDEIHAACAQLSRQQRQRISTSTIGA